MEKDNEQKNATLVSDTFNILRNKNIDIPLEHVKNLVQNAPIIKDLFIKLTDTTEKSSENVFNIIKTITSIYEEELKREGLTYEQRMDIYDRMD